MDITNTMSEYFEQIKNNILTVKDKIHENCFGVKLRIGFLGYKDYLDYDMDPESYVNVPLTEDFNFLKAQIGKVIISGGGDVPEDLAWGLKNAQVQLCSGFDGSSKADTKYVILITDAPCHGGKYHDLGKYVRGKNEDGDNYIEGDRKKIDVDQIIKSMAKNDINFYCVKISDKTDKMFQIFEEIYRNNTQNSSNFVIVKNENPEHLPKLITESINRVFNNRNDIVYDN